VTVRFSSSTLLYGVSYNDNKSPEVTAETWISEIPHTMDSAPMILGNELATIKNLYSVVSEVGYKENLHRSFKSRSSGL
jgi:hypothetical protein